MSTIREKIIDRLLAIEDLPSSGPQFLETQRLVCSKKEDAAVVAAVIEKDMALAAKVLKVANSIFYSGRYGEIGNLQQAIARLGMDEVCRITMAFKAMAIFTKGSGLVDPELFWHHSIAVAMVTRNITTFSGNKKLDVGEAYIAGLLHDLGIVILDLYFSDVYRKVREVAASTSESLFSVEKKLLDIEHGEIGAIILERWRFPEAIVSAVRNHNYPDGAPESHLSLTQLVHLADFACAAVGAGEPGDAVPQTFSLGAWNDLKMDTEQLQKIVTETEEEITRAKVLFKI